jgi:ABC-type uncharacterized transport system permease subunit
MAHPLLFSLIATASLLPITLTAFRRGEGVPDMTRAWLALAAFAGSLIAVLMPFITEGTWVGGFSSTLWLSVSASLAAFLLLSLVRPQIWRLQALFFPYLLLLGLLATVWSGAEVHHALRHSVDAWLVLHIFFSIATYALSTVAAIAALAVLLQQRALKRKEPTALTRSLPSVTDGDALLVNLLLAAGTVLGIGVVTGSVLQLTSYGGLLPFDHKTILSLVALVVIAVLLWLHQSSGLRGRRASQLVLACYLLLTLAYPGVKFVTDVILGQQG